MDIVYKIKSKKELGTVKYGLKLSDGNIIEAMIFQKDYTMCLSSQVGCCLGCVFCESGQSGFIRNLTDQEIYDQFIIIENDLNPNIFPRGA